MSREAVVHNALGQRIESDAELAKLIEERGTDDPYLIAEVYGATGHLDKTFEWLERDYAERDSGLSYLRVDPGRVKAARTAASRCRGTPPRFTAPRYRSPHCPNRRPLQAGRRRPIPPQA